MLIQIKHISNLKINKYQLLFMVLLSMSSFIIQAAPPQQSLNIGKWERTLKAEAALVCIGFRCVQDTENPQGPTVTWHKVGDIIGTFHSDYLRKDFCYVRWVERLAAQEKNKWVQQEAARRRRKLQQNKKN